MSTAALQAVLDRERAHARASFHLDDELGTHHGLAWADFVLLESLQQDAAAVPDTDLAVRLGLLRSQLLLRVRPLEKIGLLSRRQDAGGRRAVALTTAGRRRVREASETAAEVCARLASTES